jgi:hypothetical protein
VVPLLEVVPLLDVEPPLLDVVPLLDVLPLLDVVPLLDVPPELDPLEEDALLPPSSVPPPPPNGPPTGASLAPLQPIQPAASIKAPRTKPVRIGFLFVVGVVVTWSDEARLLSAKGAARGRVPNASFVPASSVAGKRFLPHLSVSADR